MKKIFLPLTRIGNIAYGFLILLLVLTGGSAALSVLGLPKQYRLFVVQSGSMKSAINTGSLVVIKPADDYKENDIITFKTKPDADIKNPKSTITHRIVSVEKKDDKVFYVTKGDANNAPDLEKIDKDSVLGKMIFAIPLLGYPVGFAKTQTGFILLIIIPATIIVYSEAVNIKKEVCQLIAKKKKKNVEKK